MSVWFSCLFFFFFKQKTAYEMRISDWSSDVCSSDLLGLGGSATNDAGAGLLQALGVRLLDKQGNELPAGGAALAMLERLSLDDVDPRLHEVEFEIAVDVDNPLCGQRGAPAIFGPHKGDRKSVV